MSTSRIVSLALMLMAVVAAGAQTVVSGLVRDAQTGKVLSSVSIMAEGSSQHTVTNDEGRFRLRMPRQPHYLLLSHVGYQPLRVRLFSGQNEQLEILMTQGTVQLSELVVSVANPYELVREAMRRIPRNYPGEAELVRCFYRETARKGSRFIAIAEAVADMYKTSYYNGPEFDAVAIVKGRRLMSMKGSDTLGIKVQGGPITPLMADVAKNPDYMLNDQMLIYCDFHMETPVRIGGRLHHVVEVVPRPSTPLPLMGGRLFIDQQSLTISRAELQLDMRDWRKASKYMLVRKPPTLRFRPRELSMTVVYETDDQGIAHMSYLCNRMRFNCDWRRHLFASAYTTVIEMVVTDRLQHGREARPPKGRAVFGSRECFYDNTEYFEDPDFWDDYNIILPTESLEHAIDKLKKKKSNNTTQ